MTSNKKKSPEELRSHRWFGRDDMRGFGHRPRLKQWLDRSDWAEPVIGIVNTWSELSPATPICAPAPRPSSAASCKPAAFRSSCRR